MSEKEENVKIEKNEEKLKTVSKETLNELIGIKTALDSLQNVVVLAKLGANARSQQLFKNEGLPEGRPYNVNFKTGSVTVVKEEPVKEENKEE